MATIEKRGSKFRVVYRFDGRKFSKTLKTKSEREAQALAFRLEDNLRRVSLGTLLVPTEVDLSTFLFSDGKLTEPPKAEPRLTLSEGFASYFDSLPEGALEANTMALMRIHERQVTTILGRNFALAKLSHDDLQRFVRERSKSKGIRGRLVKGSTVRKALVTFRSVWNWAVKAEKLKGDFPMDGLRFPKTDEKPPFQTWPEIERQIKSRKLSKFEARDLWDCLFLTMREIDACLRDMKEATRLPFMFPMLTVAAFTGARRSEILRLQIGDIDFTARKISIREKKRCRGRNTTRRVPMSDRLEVVLRNWLQTNAGAIYVFPSRGAGGNQLEPERPIIPHQANRYLRQTVAGTKWEVIRGWHVFRHSFCSNLAAKGVDQRMIDAWVGHTTDEMRIRYRHLIPDLEQSVIASVFR